MEEELTLGQQRIRTYFSPSEMKDKFAELIDLVQQQITETSLSEEKRLAALASTSIEEAAMWAVKLLTFNK